MKDFYTQKYAAGLLFCLLAALSWPNGADAVYTMNETCAYLQKGYIGDPTSCQNWGYCSGGLLVATGKCAAGLLYDSAQGVCNYAADVVCQTTTQDICNNLDQAQYIGNPNNCQNYCYCANKVLTCFNCPANQVFNPDTETCVWGRDYTCPANSICRLVENNQFVGDPAKCGNWLRCQDGTGVSKPCETGSFNPMKNGCDPNYVCKDNGNTGTPGIPTTNTAACAPYVTATGGKQYMSDGETCYGFYLCDSATGPGQWGSCPFATHFNPTLQKCVTPYTYACPKDRCQNINLPFVTAVNSQCKGYSICSNQKTVGTGTCAGSFPDFPYYDEAGGSCVSTANKPAYPICT